MTSILFLIIIQRHKGREHMIDNKNNQIIIFENSNYSLIATIKSIETPSKTGIYIKLDNDIIHLGELINDNTTYEWPEVSNQAVAIIGQDSLDEPQYIKTLFYIPNKTFIDENKNTKFEELFNLKINDKKAKIKVK